ncbi:MAG: riboflavin synthase [Candidatus Omnitrophica bacterium]|nr:riboflavin synthase [Candidatus Omnitrophota bacterium]
MFTGIIEDVGVIKKTGKAVTIQTTVPFSGVKVGDSVAVDGVCLTVTGIVGNSMTFDLMDQTIRASTLGHSKTGDNVNLETSLKAGAPVSGHFVYGHIDGVRPVVGISKFVGAYGPRLRRESSHTPLQYIDIGIEKDDEKYIVRKGSIAIDGISLTIAEVHSSKIRIGLIPHTLRNTNLLEKGKGDLVNVEFDMIAKYLHKQHTTGSPLSDAALRKAGFTGDTGR